MRRQRQGWRWRRWRWRRRGGTRAAAAASAPATTPGCHATPPPRHCSWCVALALPSGWLARAGGLCVQALPCWYSGCLGPACRRGGGRGSGPAVWWGTPPTPRGVLLGWPTLPLLPLGARRHRSVSLCSATSCDPGRRSAMSPGWRWWRRRRHTSRWRGPVGTRWVGGRGGEDACSSSSRRLGLTGQVGAGGGWLGQGCPTAQWLLVPTSEPAILTAPACLPGHPTPCLPGCRTRR